MRIDPVSPMQVLREQNLGFSATPIPYSPPGFNLHSGEKKEISPACSSTHPLPPASFTTSHETTSTKRRNPADLESVLLWMKPQLAFKTIRHPSRPPPTSSFQWGTSSSFHPFVAMVQAPLTRATLALGGSSRTFHSAIRKGVKHNAMA